MATDTLEIFGTEYTGVTGIKATDDNSQTKTYIRPQGTIQISTNGSGIDVTEYASADVAVSGATLQSSKSYTVSASGSATISPDAGYDAMEAVALTVPSGTAGTPTASKGAVSNHAVTVTPSVTNSAGYIAGGTKTGTGVSVTAAELVSGKKEITANGDNIDVTEYAQVKVNVGGGGKNVQAYIGYASRTANSYGATSVTLTVAKTGTYKVSWCAARGSSTGTMGTNLHIDSTAGTNQQTWTGTYWQNIVLENQSLTQGTVLTLYATSGNTSRTVYVGNLVIEEQ